MRTQYEIEMVRNERGVWSAAWELHQARPAASDQAAASATPSEMHSSQDRYSWREWLRALIPSWKDESEGLAQPAA
jgi:hypothetical protein